VAIIDISQEFTSYPVEERPTHYHGVWIRFFPRSAGHRGKGEAFVIFLCLAALYESWSIPLSVLLALPLGAIGGVIGSTLRGLSKD